MINTDPSNPEFQYANDPSNPELQYANDKPIFSKLYNIRSCIIFIVS